MPCECAPGRQVQGAHGRFRARAALAAAALAGLVAIGGCTGGSGAPASSSTQPPLPTTIGSTEPGSMLGAVIQAQALHLQFAAAVPLQGPGSAPTPDPAFPASGVQLRFFSADRTDVLINNSTSKQQTRIVDGKAYVEAGGSWYTGDPAAKLIAATMLQAWSPLRLAAALPGVPLRVVASTQLDDVHAIQFEGAVPVQGVVDKILIPLLPESGTAERALLEGSAHRLRGQSAQVDVWVSPAGIPLRFDVSGAALEQLRLDGSDGGDDPDLDDLRVEYRDWGVPFPITAPAASEVHTLGTDAGPLLSGNTPVPTSTPS